MKVHGAFKPLVSPINLHPYSEAIREGADSFLFAEYKICAYFIVIFGAIILVLVSYSDSSWCGRCKLDPFLA